MQAVGIGHGPCRCPRKPLGYNQKRMEIKKIMNQRGHMKQLLTDQARAADALSLSCNKM
jgi:hypothetical protein